MSRAAQVSTATRIAVFAAAAGSRASSSSASRPVSRARTGTKGGVQSFTHAIAAEYAEQGLRAVSVAPGSIASGMTAGPGLPEDADMSWCAKLRPAIGEGFAGPETVAGVIAMPASDDGAFVTGTEIRIDGGTHA